MCGHLKIIPVLEENDGIVVEKNASEDDWEFTPVPVATQTVVGTMSNFVSRPV